MGRERRGRFQHGDCDAERGCHEHYPIIYSHDQFRSTGSWIADLAFRDHNPVPGWNVVR